MLVGQLVNRNEWLWWSWMCGGCGVGVIFSSGWVCRPLCLFSLITPTSACVIMIHPHDRTTNMSRTPSHLWTSSALMC
jgi:uncharacterized membrane protein YdcZ (DUF606 family)